MADDADLPALGLQPFQGVDGEVEAGSVEEAEALFDEQCCGGAAFTAHAGQGQRERQRYKETLAAGQPPALPAAVPDHGCPLSG